MTLRDKFERTVTTRECEKITSRYAYFLKQPLKLEMFVPCDDDEIIIERHYQYFDNEKEHENYIKEIEEAKEKVLFEGFRFQNEGYVTNGIFKFDEEYLENKTIEDLIKYDLELTKSAIKKIGL
jgi:hypothetical protein